MFAKRGLIKIVSGRYLFLLVLALLLVPAIVHAGTGLECNLPSQNTLSYCGGASIINNPGYGAVELCQVCYQCGKGDGVCPEDYSDGINETNTEKLTVPMSVKRSVFNSFRNRYTAAFETGNLACASLAGDCDYIERSNTGTSWSTDSGGCSLNVSFDSSTNYYYRAICKSVPRKAGCEYCPDPDCKTLLSGIAYSGAESDYLEGVIVEISGSNNTNLQVIPNGTTDSNGDYEMTAVTGYVDITCHKQGYFAKSARKYLKSGKNIFDCVMTNMTEFCTKECFIDDGSGTRTCNSLCDGINGCNVTALAKTECKGYDYQDKIYLNTAVLLDALNNCSYEQVTSLVCCAGDLISQNNTIYAPGGCHGFPPAPFPNGSLYVEGNLSNMLTRNYKKELNGRSITLSIRTYTK